MPVKGCKEYQVLMKGQMRVIALTLSLSASITNFLPLDRVYASTPPHSEHNSPGSVYANQSTHQKSAGWTYAGERGPRHWAGLEAGSQCGGQAQSPVNIIRTDSTPNTSAEWPLSLHYPISTRLHSVTNNGHSIEFDFDQGDEISFRGTRYGLRQLHFHEPSEHTLNGVRYPIEMHMVHYNTSHDRYVVLSVLGFEGTPSSGYDELEAYLPLEEGSTRTIDKPFDLAAILPTTLTPRFHYQGSLTTPPCTENVDWIVFEQPFMLSESQVNRLRDNMPINNYRDVQPLNGRGISLVIH